MGLFIDASQVMDTYFCIDLSRVQARMSEHLLDASEIGPVFHHVRSATVPQQVATAFLFDACRLDCFADPVSQIVRVEALAVTSDKKGRFNRTDAEHRTTVFKIRFEPAAHTCTERQKAAFAALPFPHVHCSCLQVDVSKVQRDNFTVSVT